MSAVALRETLDIEQSRERLEHLAERSLMASLVELSTWSSARASFEFSTWSNESEWTMGVKRAFAETADEDPRSLLLQRN